MIAESSKHSPPGASSRLRVGRQAQFLALSQQRQLPGRAGRLRYVRFDDCLRPGHVRSIGINNAKATPFSNGSTVGRIDPFGTMQLIAAVVERWHIVNISGYRSGD